MSTTTPTRGPVSVTAALRAEHADLLPHVEAIRAAADAVDATDTADLIHRVSAVHTFLERGLIVHATAEDAALYPVVESFLGAGATATMSRDHAEVVRLTDELGEARDRLALGRLEPDLARELRRVLYGLYAVVSLHFAKEEQVYLPILDARLNPTDATQMFEDMHAAAVNAATSRH